MWLCEPNGACWHVIASVWTHKPDTPVPAFFKGECILLVCKDRKHTQKEQEIAQQFTQIDVHACQPLHTQCRQCKRVEFVRFHQFVTNVITERLWMNWMSWDKSQGKNKEEESAEWSQSGRWTWQVRSKKLENVTDIKTKEYRKDSNQGGKGWASRQKAKWNVIWVGGIEDKEWDQDSQNEEATLFGKWVEDNKCASHCLQKERCGDD